jgi:hypothetical protein
VAQHRDVLWYLHAEPSSRFPDSASAYTVRGTFKASKGRQSEAAANVIQVLIMILRLPHKASDIILTMNTPVFVNERSAAAQDTGAGPKTLHYTAPDLFTRMISSFEILDWNLITG